MHILITGAFAPGTSGTAWSLRRPGLFGQPPRLSGSDCVSGIRSPYLDQVFKLPHGSHPDYIGRLIELCEIEKVDLVVPQTTSETITLAESNGKIPPQIRIATLNPKKRINQLVSKVESYKYISKSDLYKHDFQICKSLGQLNEYIKISKEDEFFIKADSLSGGRGIVSVVSNLSKVLEMKPKSYHVISIQQAPDAFVTLNNGKGLVLQKVAKGTEYSIDCYRDEFVQIARPRRRDKIRSGISQETTVEFNEKLIQAGIIFGEKLGLLGVYGLQCIQSEAGELSFLECNPRIQGTMVASTISGENLIGRAAKLALGMESEPIKKISWGVKFTRGWGGTGEFNGQFTEI